MREERGKGIDTKDENIGTEKTDIVTKDVIMTMTGEIDIFRAGRRRLGDGVRTESMKIEGTMIDGLMMIGTTSTINVSMTSTGVAPQAISTLGMSVQDATIAN